MHISLHDTLKNTSPAVHPKSETEISEIPTPRGKNIKKIDLTKSKERYTNRVKDFLKNAENTMANSSISLQNIIGNSRATISTSDLSEIECRKYS